jgi:hypothetical protein
MRYTFSDEEQDLDSEDTSVRRSKRQSNRESPVPAGPTVTASGRQVRSRATGAYGETLLSGQTTDRASPATGDYVRSEASQEPHGRPTRAAATKAVDGFTTKKRKHTETYADMEDEEDATSWDGGDEDEDEPTQMDVDDNENDDEEEQSDNDASDNDDEPKKSLVVHLKYPQGSFSSPPPPQSTVRDEDTVMSSAPAPPQPTPQPSAPASNGTSHPETTPLVPVDASVPSSTSTEPQHKLPKLESLFRAPTPPYTSQEETKPNSVSSTTANEPALHPIETTTW